MRLRNTIFVGHNQAAALAHVYRQYFAPLPHDRVVYLAATGEGSSADAIAEQMPGDDKIVIEKGDDDIAWMSQFEAGGVVAFPFCYAGFLWPFAGQAHPNNTATEHLPEGPYPPHLGDTFLNQQLLQAVSPLEAYDRYIALDMAVVGKLDELFDVCLTRQRIRDSKAGFGVADLIAGTFRKQALFLAPDRPALPLFQAIARHVYTGLGHPRARVEDVLKSLQRAPFFADALPVHPRTAAHFDLGWADEDTRYGHLNEGRFTFAQYVHRYMEYAWNPALQEGMHLVASAPERALELLNQGLVHSPEAREALLCKVRILRRLGRLAQAQVVLAEGLESDQQNPEWHVEQAAVLLAQGKLDAAEASVRRALGLSRHFAGAHRVLAEVLAARGDVRGAIKRTRRAVALEPKDAPTRFALASLQFRAGQLEAAEIALRQTESLEPGGGRVQLLRADILLRQGQHAAALPILKELAATSTRDPHVHGRLGHAFVQTGDLAAAARAFRAATEIDPSLEGMQYALADVLDRQGQHEAALAILRQMVEKPSNNPHIHARLGHLLMRLDDLPGAEAAFRTASVMDPTVEGFRGSLANVLSRQGRREEALNILREVIAKPSASAHSHALYGHILLQSGELREAEEAFRTASRVDPATPGFRTSLADVMIRQGRHDAALPVLQELAARPTNDPQIFAQLGQVLLQKDNLVDAEHAFRKAVALAPAASPGEDRLLVSHADVLHRLGRRNEALEILRALCAKPGTNPHLHARLGHLLLQSGELAEAEAAFRAASERDPEVDGFRSALADVLQRQGQHAAALEILRALAKTPGADGQLHARIGHILAQTGDFSGAEAALRAALALVPNAERFEVALADILTRQGKNGAAEEILKALVAKPSGDPQIHARYANLLLQGGDLPGAEAAFRMALDIDPELDAVHGALAEVLNRQGEHDAALAMLRTLTAKPNCDSHIHAQLGQLLDQLEDIDGAEQAFRNALALRPDSESFRKSLNGILQRREAAFAERMAVAVDERADLLDEPEPAPERQTKQKPAKSRWLLLKRALEVGLGTSP